jgi:hypothetical protein
MPIARRTFNCHDFTYGACVCGLTREQYDDIRQPLCAGPRNAASMAHEWTGRVAGGIRVVSGGSTGESWQIGSGQCIISSCSRGAALSPRTR